MVTKFRGAMVFLLNVVSPKALKALFLIESSLFVVVIFYYDHIRVSTTGFLLGVQ
jgi:hypothetical protein